MGMTRRTSPTAVHRTAGERDDRDREEEAETGPEAPSARPVTTQIGIASGASAGTCPSSQNAAVSAANPSPQGAMAPSNRADRAAVDRLARRSARVGPDGCGTDATGLRSWPGAPWARPVPSRFARLALPMRR